MKKLIVLTVILMGSAFSLQLFAQSDLDYTNSTNCTFNYSIKSDDGTGTCTQAGAVFGTMPPTTLSVTITCAGGGSPAYAFQVIADDGFGNFALVGDPTYPCAGIPSATGTIPAGSPGCLSGASFVFTPAGGSNAVLTIF